MSISELNILFCLIFSEGHNKKHPLIQCWLVCVCVCLWVCVVKKEGRWHCPITSRPEAKSQTQFIIHLLTGLIAERPNGHRWAETTEIAMFQVLNFITTDFVVLKFLILELQLRDHVVWQCLAWGALERQKSSDYRNLCHPGWEIWKLCLVTV